MRGTEVRRRGARKVIACAGLLLHASLATAAPKGVQSNDGRESSTASGEDLFRQGRAAMAQGDCRRAVALFERSLSLDPAVGTLLNLAVCEERLGALVRASELLRRAAAAASNEDPRRDLALARAAGLERRFAHLTLRVSESLGPGVHVLVDGEIVPEASFGRSFAIDPGTHVLSLEGSSIAPWTKLVRAGTAEQLFEFVPVQPERKPAGKISQRLHQPQSQPSTAPAWILTGLGVLGVGTGLVAGVGVLREKAAVDRHCNDQRCDGEGLAAAGRGKRWSMVSTLATSVGLVSFAGAAYLWVSARPRGSQGVVVSVGGNL